MKRFNYKAVAHLLLVVLSSVFATGNASADNYNQAPRLFAVTVPGLKSDPKEFDIPVQFGKGKTTPIALSDTWRVYGGTVYDQRPGSTRPILVELHGTIGPNRKLITRVMVRYYQNADGRWQPLYQLNQEPLMVKTPAGWKPLFDTRESPEILGVMNRKLPNPAGYRPYIDFKTQRGKIIIDAWEVKRHR